MGVWMWALGGGGWEEGDGDTRGLTAWRRWAFGLIGAGLQATGRPGGAPGAGDGTALKESGWDGVCMAWACCIWAAGGLRPCGKDLTTRGWWAGVGWTGLWAGAGCNAGLWAGAGFEAGLWAGAGWTAAIDLCGTTALGKGTPPGRTVACAGTGGPPDPAWTTDGTALIWTLQVAGTECTTDVWDIELSMLWDGNPGLTLLGSLFVTTI